MIFDSSFIADELDDFQGVGPFAFFSSQSGNNASDAAAGKLSGTYQVVDAIFGKNSLPVVVEVLLRGFLNPPELSIVTIQRGRVSGTVGTVCASFSYANNENVELLSCKYANRDYTLMRGQPGIIYRHTTESGGLSYFTGEHGYFLVISADGTDLENVYSLDVLNK